MPLLDPFRYEFFTRGLLAATLVGGLCGLVGVYIVLRRMSYMGHGLSHAVFGGAVASSALQVDVYLGAGLWGFLSALLIGAIARKRQIAADAAIGIVTTASFAAGVLLISKQGKRFTKNPEALLWGSMLGIRPEDLALVVAVSLLAVLTILALYKKLLFTTFDPEVARLYGVNTTLIEAGFSLLLAATIIVSMQVVGVMLIAAAIVVPAIVARLLTDSFSTMLWLSALLGALCGLAGMYASYYLDASPGASIVLLSAAVFALVLGGALLIGRRERERATSREASRQASRAASIAALYD